jgi:hypothetical protein
VLRKVFLLYGSLLLIALAISRADVLPPFLPGAPSSSAAGAALGETYPESTPTPQNEEATPTPSRPNSPPTALAGTYFVAEGDAVTLLGRGFDPDGDPITYSWDLTGDGVFETKGQNPFFSAVGLDGPLTLPVVLQVCDSHDECVTSDGLVSIANSPPVVGPVRGIPTAPLPLNATVVVSVDFTDAGVRDNHVAVWDWGDGTTSPGTVAGGNGAGTASGTRVYAKAGEYVIKVTVTDKDGSSGESLSAPFRVGPAPSGRN